MTANNKNLAANTLFWFQLISAWFFSVPQFLRAFTSTEGMTITWPTFCSAFVAINLFLAISVYRNSTDKKKTLQVVWVYVNWFVLLTAISIITTVKAQWSKQDSILSGIILASVCMVLIIRHRETVVATITEPINRGIIALLFKSVPQLYIGYCIVMAGGNSGLALTTLVIGHVTVNTRIAEIYLSTKKAWNQKTIALMISEVGNEVSWLVVTLIWLAYR